MAAAQLSAARCSRVIGSRQVTAPRRLPAASNVRKLVLSRVAQVEANSSVKHTGGSGVPQCAYAGALPDPTPPGRRRCRPAHLPTDRMLGAAEKAEKKKHKEEEEEELEGSEDDGLNPQQARPQSPAPVPLRRVVPWATVWP